MILLSQHKLRHCFTANESEAKMWQRILPFREDRANFSYAGALGQWNDIFYSALNLNCAKNNCEISVSCPPCDHSLRVISSKVESLLHVTTLPFRLRKTGHQIFWNTVGQCLVIIFPKHSLRSFLGSPGEEKFERRLKRFVRVSLSLRK